MADRDVRGFERDASGGDPEAQRRHQRQFCRQNGHRWTHYKGGESVCERCGMTEEAPDRELGNQTVYYSAPDISHREYIANLISELPPEYGENVDDDASTTEHDPADDPA